MLNRAAGHPMSLMFGLRSQFLYSRELRRDLTVSKECSFTARTLTLHQVLGLKSWTNSSQYHTRVRTRVGTSHSHNQVLVQNVDTPD